MVPVLLHFHLNHHSRRVHLMHLLILWHGQAALPAPIHFSLNHRNRKVHSVHHLVLRVGQEPRQIRRKSWEIHGGQDRPYPADKTAGQDFNRPSRQYFSNHKLAPNFSPQLGHHLCRQILRNRLHRQWFDQHFPSSKIRHQLSQLQFKEIRSMLCKQTPVHSR